jgi:hypothetical protein
MRIDTLHKVTAKTMRNICATFRLYTLRKELYHSINSKRERNKQAPRNKGGQDHDKCTDYLSGRTGISRKRSY